MAFFEGNKDAGVSKRATTTTTSKTFHDPEPNVRNAWLQYRLVWL